MKSKKYTRVHAGTIPQPKGRQGKEKRDNHPSFFLPLLLLL
jgi:hypothetical protein